MFKRLALLVSTIAVAVLLPVSVFAWGPTDRDTFTVAHPAGHITFDSITDNPDLGDERNFVRIKDASDNSGWSDSVTAQAGHEYIVMMYVHNDAASNLNLVAENVTASATVPTTTGKSVEIDGFISSTNSTPGKIWDQATLTSNSADFNVAYVPGSATYYNNVFTNGTALPDSIVTSTGAKLGYDKLDGKIPGCFQYSGYVYFKVKAQFAEGENYSLTKQVSAHGKNQWSTNYQAQPGETVDYLLSYKNTGTTTENNVVLSDALPKNVSLVNGSTYVANTANPNGLLVGDEITTTGINIGNYAPGATAYVKFSAVVGKASDLTCGVNKLVNTGKVSVDGTYKTATAEVDVNNDTCSPPELPHTGPTETIVSVLGAGAVVASLGYYLSSRKALGSVK